MSRKFSRKKFHNSLKKMIFSVAMGICLATMGTVILIAVIQISPLRKSKEINTTVISSLNTNTPVGLDSEFKQELIDISTLKSAAPEVPEEVRSFVDENANKQQDEQKFTEKENISSKPVDTVLPSSGQDEYKIWRYQPEAQRSIDFKDFYISELNGINIKLKDCILAMQTQEASKYLCTEYRKIQRCVQLATSNQQIKDCYNRLMKSFSGGGDDDGDFSQEDN